MAWHPFGATLRQRAQVKILYNCGRAFEKRRGRSTGPMVYQAPLCPKLADRPGRVGSLKIYASL
jgi:hypothetical protein